VRCDADTMAAGRYALVRPIRLLTRDDSGPAAAAFVEFVLSPEGQRIVRDSGLMPTR
jgi:ABC-type phosphate transport system substrate-binding protein